MFILFNSIAHASLTQMFPSRLSVEPSNNRHTHINGWGQDWGLELKFSGGSYTPPLRLLILLCIFSACCWILWCELIPVHTVCLIVSSLFNRSLSVSVRAETTCTLLKTWRCPAAKTLLGAHHLTLTCLVWVSTHSFFCQNCPIRANYQTKSKIKHKLNTELC